MTSETAAIIAAILGSGGLGAFVNNAFTKRKAAKADGVSALEMDRIRFQDWMKNSQQEMAKQQEAYLTELREVVTALTVVTDLLKNVLNGQATAEKSAERPIRQIDELHRQLVPAPQRRAGDA